MKILKMIDYISCLLAFKDIHNVLFQTVILLKDSFTRAMSTSDIGTFKVLTN